MPRFPRVSPTTETLSSRVFSELVQYAKSLPHEVAPLHVGDTYREPLLAARAESQASSLAPQLHGYAPVQGEPVLLDAIEARLKKRHGVTIPRHCIQVMSGATAGLSVVTQALLDPGDEVILPSPFWPLIRGIIAGRGAVPVQVPWFDRLESESFDPERALEDARSDRTAAIYINSPHNPTGSVLSPEVIKVMLAFAKKHDLWVLSDEAYDELTLTGAPAQSTWAYPDAAGRTIACHTLSKNYGLAGSRVGFAHGPEDAMRAIRGTQTFTTYCAPRPMQFGAARALHDGDAWLEESRQAYRRAAALTADALSIKAPPGGTFVLFDASAYLQNGETDALPFLRRCVDAGVLLTPGAACGRDYGCWVRLCFTCVAESELAAALIKLKRVCVPS